MIQTLGLTKSFGHQTALAGVDLSVERGSLVALMGPNGAGKTTLLRILATITRPTSGSIRIAGLDPRTAGEDVRRQIGFLSHRPLLYEDLTADQNLRFYSAMYDLQDGPARVRDLLQRVGLAARRHDLVRTFSRGMQQRLSLARAMLHRPSLLLLDEPYTGLDYDAAAMLTELLAESAEAGTTVVLATHELDRGLATGERVVVLARGRIVHDVPRPAIDKDAFPALYSRLTR